MSERKFLGCLLIEGIMLTTLSLCILILPKLTDLSFGIMLSATFITYGIYKIISSVFNKHHIHSFLYELLLGVFILTIGILLLFVPKISLLWLVALIGVYFLLESISTSAFMSQIRTTYNFWGCKFFCAVILFLIGLIIVVTLPAAAFWTIAMLSGIGYLIKGVSKIALFNANKERY